MEVMPSLNGVARRSKGKIGVDARSALAQPTNTERSKSAKGRTKRRSIFSPEEKKVGLQYSIDREFGGLKTPLERKLEAERNRVKETFEPDPSFASKSYRRNKRSSRRNPRVPSSRLNKINTDADDQDDDKSNDSSIMDKSFHMMGGSVASSISSCDGSRAGDRSPFIIDDSDSYISQSSADSRIGITPSVYHTPSDDDYSSHLYPQSPLNLFMPGKESPIQSNQNITDAPSYTTTSMKSPHMNSSSSSRSSGIMSSSFSSRLLPLKEEGERCGDVVSNALAASMVQHEYERSSQIINEALASTGIGLASSPPHMAKQGSQNKLQRKRSKVTRFFHRFTADRHRRAKNSSYKMNPSEEKSISLGQHSFNSSFSTDHKEDIHDHSSLDHPTSDKHDIGVSSTTNISTTPKEKTHNISTSPSGTPELLAEVSSDLKVFVLVILPSERLFELIQVTYDPLSTSIGDILHLISDNCTEEKLVNQRRSGLCRPTSGKEDVSMTDLSMKASGKRSDGHCARIQHGEILVAIPQGHEASECQALAKQILKNPALLKLLARADPLRKSEKKRSTRFKKSSAQGHLLGISSRSNDASQYSSSISSPVETIEEEEDNDETENDSQEQNSRNLHFDGKDKYSAIVGEHLACEKRNLHFDEKKLDDEDNNVEESKLEAIQRAIEMAKETYRKVLTEKLEKLKLSNSEIGKVLEEEPIFFYKSQ